jgi:predicted AAA+ superfamily ATPase
MESHLYKYNPWWENDYIFESFYVRPLWEKKLIEQLEHREIVFLTGLRRVGKTTLMKLVSKYLILEKGVAPRHIFYISLDDFFLRDTSILDIVQMYRKVNQISVKTKVWLFLDEITYKVDYELQLKNLYDLGNTKVFATSSSASLLKTKTAYLTGRNVMFEVLPLNFDEFLTFRQYKFDKADKHLKDQAFLEFLETGGMPEYVLYKKADYMNNLVNNIIQKDIAAQNNISNIRLLQDFFLLLMERSGKQVSINKLANILSISPDTALRYFNMFVEAYLIFPIVKHGKTNQQILSPKKIYAADIGIRSFYTGFRDLGSLFENYVFLQIKHLNPKYISENTIELDFFTQEKILVEAKFHNEQLSDKQQKLFNEFKAKDKFIVRNYEDIKSISTP